MFLNLIVYFVVDKIWFIKLEGYYSNRNLSNIYASKFLGYPRKLLKLFPVPGNGPLSYFSLPWWHLIGVYNNTMI